MFKLLALRTEGSLARCSLRLPLLTPQRPHCRPLFGTSASISGRIASPSDGTDDQPSTPGNGLGDAPEIRSEKEWNPQSQSQQQQQQPQPPRRQQQGSTNGPQRPSGQKAGKKPSRETWPAPLKPLFRAVIAIKALILQLFRNILRPLVDPSILGFFPFELRQFLYRLCGPPPLPLHASPALEALLSSKLKTPVTKLGYTMDGRVAASDTVAPLSDVPRWRIEDLLEVPIRQVQLYRQALTSPTILRETNDGGRNSYEVLEYLGDAVLSLVVREAIMERHPAADEDMLTRIEQNITNGRNLAAYAKGLRLDSYIAYNANIMRNKVVPERVFEDALEALIGALYLDRGMPACRTVVWRVVEQFSDAEDLTKNFNFKSKLLRFASKKGLSMPTFHQLPGKGEFRVSVRMAGVEWGRGTGPSKKEGEQDAARAVLERLGLAFTDGP